ncbi:SRPBCC family protein [Streptomyces sp. HNM0575]|uniref:SRPBCC family protein n=1 Tax=Streptomyces sp. HNM0575 TaxID=2716338 RepID=UPI00145DC3A7|nr:SRPBCC family protein [Streptomyces sp. HNM0575]NLU71372.1 SRPBCC family protein [Streptomyces sp. HNM0575]
MPDTKTEAGKGSSGSPDGSGLDRVREELTKFLLAKANNLVSSAGKKTGEFAKKAASGGDGAGAGLADSVGDVLKGESPAKALGGQVAKGVKDKTLGKVQELFSGGGKAGEKKVTNIVEVLDVGLPLRRVYDHWTEFEEFSGFMKGVVEASRPDDDEDDGVTSDWTLKVGPSKRSWQATVLEQVPDERIVWETKGETKTHGAVSFHRLAPDLTRVVVVVEYTPGGFLEKTANLWRAQGRRLRLDLKHFQRYVTLGVQEVPEGWRGEIREGELVRSHEDALAQEEEEEEDEEGGQEGGGAHRGRGRARREDEEGEFEDEEEYADEDGGAGRSEDEYGEYEEEEDEETR